MVKSKVVEADIAAQEDRLRKMTKLAESLAESDQFDSAEVLAKKEEMSERFSHVQDLASHRQALLSEASNLYQFFKDIDHQESLINQIKLQVASEDYNCDLETTRSLVEDQERMERELDTQEAAIQQLEEAGLGLHTGHQQLHDGDLEPDVLRAALQPGQQLVPHCRRC